jgi:hypothetical protein
MGGCLRLLFGSKPSEQRRKAAAVPTAPTNAAYHFVPTYGLPNANADLRGVGRMPIDVGLFASNLTRTIKPVGVLDRSVSRAGTVDFTDNELRMYGSASGFCFGNQLMPPGPPKSPHKA